MMLEIPIRTVSLTNQREHWRTRAKRAKAQRKAVAMCWPRSFRPALPCAVTITRCAPRKLDDDNLRGALKHVRDEVAKQLGVDDRDKRVAWRYGQAKSKAYSVRVETMDALQTSAIGPGAKKNSMAMVGWPSSTGVDPEPNADATDDSDLADLTEQLEQERHARQRAERERDEARAQLAAARRDPWRGDQGPLAAMLRDHDLRRRREKTRSTASAKHAENEELEVNHE